MTDTASEAQLYAQVQKYKDALEIANEGLFDACALASLHNDTEALEQYKGRKSNR